MEQTWAEQTMQRILKKLEKTAPQIGANFPHASKDGKYNDEPLSWVSGFWPGILWLAYQETGNKQYAFYAEKIEEKLDEKLDGSGWKERAIPPEILRRQHVPRAGCLKLPNMCRIVKKISTGAWRKKFCAH